MIILVYNFLNDDVSSFQTGVTNLYNEFVDKGVTPTDMTLAAMKAAVGNLATHTYLGPTINYVDKDFNFGNPAGGNTSYNGTVTADMSDVVPSGKTIIGAAFYKSNSARGGGLEIASINTSTNIITCNIHYSYNDGVYATVRVWYVDSGLADSISIQYIDKAFNPGNVIGSNTSGSKVIENTFDADIPLNYITLFAGFKKFDNATGGSTLQSLEHRTCKVKVGYSYNYDVSYTIRLYYIATNVNSGDAIENIYGALETYSTNTYSVTSTPTTRSLSLSDRGNYVIVFSVGEGSDGSAMSISDISVSNGTIVKLYKDSKYAGNTWRYTHAVSLALIKSNGNCNVQITSTNNYTQSATGAIYFFGAIKLY